jgi:hypothetical protein
MPAFEKPRRVRLKKGIVHTDWTGKILSRWDPGRIVKVTADAGHYWVGVPDVFKDEGDLLDEEIDERFIQLSNN